MVNYIPSDEDKLAAVNAVKTKILSVIEKHNLLYEVKLVNYTGNSIGLLSIYALQNVKTLFGTNIKKKLVISIGEHGDIMCFDQNYLDISHEMQAIVSPPPPPTEENTMKPKQSK